MQGPASATEPPAGRALAGAERARMEAIVGGDLSGTVLHTGPDAADRAARHGALAVTEGTDVAFARGAYRPGTPAGDALLAHELAHVRQQRGGAGSGAAGAGLENEAHRAGFLAAVLLLDPALARSLPPPRVSTGHGLRLQRCTAPTYDDIGALPTREEYEQRGELMPLGLLDVVPLTDRLVLDAGPLLRLGEEPEPPRTPPLPAPDPSARALPADQLLARLTVLEARQHRIEQLTGDLNVTFRNDVGNLMAPALMLAMARQDLGAAAPFVLGAGIRQGRDPVELSRMLPRTEEAQRRAHDALLDLAQRRQRETESHAAIAGRGYELGRAEAEIDTVRWDYAKAAAFLFEPEQGRLLAEADAARAALDARLMRLLIQYHQDRAAKGDDIAPAVTEMRDWASALAAELDKLTTAASELEAAAARGEDVRAGRRAWAEGAQLIATSLDALGEWDIALGVYEMLRANSAMWGHEGVLRIADRLGQMKAASLARDEPYLRLLVRDHREDPALSEFYASIPDIISRSHLILGFVVLLLAAAVTAGVGVAIAGAAAGAAAATESAALAAGASASMAAAEAAVVLEIGLVAKIGGEAIVFTVVHMGLQSAFPGLAPGPTLSGFLTELVWNLALFGVLHGVGSAVEGALGRSAWLKTLTPMARTVLSTGARTGSTYATLQAYGVLRFLVDQGRMMTWSEIGTMSAHNLVMLAGLSLAMKPLSSMLEGVHAAGGELGRGGAEALIRFRQRYGERYRLLDSERAQLEARLRLRMEQNPQAREKDLTDITAWAGDLEARLRELNEEASTDPDTGLTALREGLTGLAAQAEAVPVPELLQRLGLDPATDLRATGDPATWTITPGKAAAVRAFLEAQGLTAVAGEVTGQPVVEVSVPGRGTVSLVERAGPAKPATTPTPALEALAAKDATVAAGLEAVRAQTVTPDLAARLESRAAGEPALVARLLRAFAELAEARAARAAPDADPAVAFEAVRAHTLALESALADPAAEAGLRLFMSWSRFRATTKAGILAAAPPENVAGFLRALTDSGVHSQPSAFYSVLARSRPASELVGRHGGAMLMKLVHMQPGDATGIRLARAQVDVERVLRGLDEAAAQSPAARDALAKAIRKLPYDARYTRLDRLVGPRPPAGPAFEPVTRPGAGWETFLAKARQYARDHPPEDGPVTRAEIETRAMLLQVVERARAQEFGELTGPERRAMLEQYNALALSARLEQGWISSTRGNFNEALARGAGRVSLRVVFLKGRVVTGGDDTTIPDDAVPPVLPRDLMIDATGTRPVERDGRLWIERKTYELGGELDPNGVSKRARQAAKDHAEEAADDLTNLPPGSTIALDYASDPGVATRNAMLRELFTVPGVVRVTFEGVPYTRASAGAAPQGGTP
ncbi:eCIS core domain-containing protein [Paractinoplanes deccanensis]|nr:DUF4157 domain-containing protein [Actinoplanes deccanensis]